MPEFEIKSKGGYRLDWPPLELARDQYPHVTGIHKFGSSTSLSSVFTPIAIGACYPMPTTATSLELVSDSTGDGVGGAGARTINVIGLSSDYTEITETVTMNSTTPVALDNDFTRVYRMYVETSGSYATSTSGSHEGNLILQEAGAGSTWARIKVDPYPHGQTQIGFYTVPKGKTGFVHIHHLSVDSNKTADIELFQRPNVDTISAPYSAMRTVVEFVGMTGATPFTDIGTPQGPFEGPCDIGFMAKASATAEVSVDYEIILVENGDA